MSKRIAIQLFGHLRSFRNTYKSFLKNVVKANEKDGYEIDVFIHTWTETDHSTITHHNMDGEKRGNAVTEGIINQIHEYYKPKKLLMENQLETDDFTFYGKVSKRNFSYKGLLNFTYTVYKSSCIRREYTKENNIKYDFVIVTRPDIFFYEPFFVDVFLATYEIHKLEVPQNGLFFTDYMFMRGLVDDKHIHGSCDILYFGTEYAIDMATNVYPLLLDENKKKTIIDNFCSCEALWFCTWINKGLEPIRIRYFPFEYEGKLYFRNIRTVGTLIIRIGSLLKKIIKSVAPYGLVTSYYQCRYFKALKKY